MNVGGAPKVRRFIPAWFLSQNSEWLPYQFTRFSLLYVPWAYATFPHFPPRYELHIPRSIAPFHGLGLTCRVLLQRRGITFFLLSITSSNDSMVSSWILFIFVGFSLAQEAIELSSQSSEQKESCSRSKKRFWNESQGSLLLQGRREKWSLSLSRAYVLEVRKFPWLFTPTTPEDSFHSKNNRTSCSVNPEVTLFVAYNGYSKIETEYSYLSRWKRCLPFTRDCLMVDPSELSQSKRPSLDTFDFFMIALRYTRIY